MIRYHIRAQRGLLTPDCLNLNLNITRITLMEASSRVMTKSHTRQIDTVERTNKRLNLTQQSTLLRLLNLDPLQTMRTSLNRPSRVYALL
jgi:hypothetical protein